jgi:hypothetical protein
MVLDHLVVQQLGQETEEGEVDNLILFGAEEIAKSNPDDTSTDRVWTKELINELIDGAEKEAEEQAKEMAARESAVETREGSENSGGDAAEKRGFSFARVWETKTHTFQDPEDTDVNEPEPFADDETWAKFLDAAEKERQVEEAIVLTDRKRKAAAKALSYNERILSLSDEDEDSDKKKRKKDKGKGKAIVDDEDFVASLVEPSDSDSEVDAQFDSVLDGPSALVRDSRGPSNVDPTGHKLSKAERHALKRRQEALRATVLGTGMVNAAAGPVIVGPSNAEPHPLIEPEPRAGRLPIL